MSVRCIALLIALAPLALTGCETPASVAVVEGFPEDGGAFITLLGADTLAVEQFRHTGDRIEAHVVLRSPETRMFRYSLELDDAGSLQNYQAIIYRPDEDGQPIEVQRSVVAPDEDALLITTTADGAEEMHTIEGDGTALPFIDMVHWPFEEMLMRAHRAEADSLVQPLFTARGTMPFVVRRVEEGVMTVTHPFRGTMEARVDQEGRLDFLTAAGTTRALTVTRVPAFDTEAFAVRSAARDAAGDAFGPLSGRAETVATVGGATIRIEHGQPAKRGRDIFGNLVEWGEFWRTGADRATHFETSADLQIGDLHVPAGEYTLFSIPEPEGGTLIINRQTGQTGTAHDPDQDLGRVPMTAVDLDETVELFTIDAVETDDGGELRIEWDRTAFVVPFTVAD